MKKEFLHLLLLLLHIGRCCLQRVVVAVDVQRDNAEARAKVEKRSCVGGLERLSNPRGHRSFMRPSGSIVGGF